MSGVIVNFPAFSGTEIRPYEMRALVKAIEHRFQGLEQDTFITLAGENFTIDDLDARYASQTHGHTEGDISDLQSYLTGLSGSSIFDLSDVNGTPVNNDILVWNASAGAFQLTTFSTSGNALDSLSDVHVPDPGDGDSLVYNNANSRWEASATGAVVTIAGEQTVTGEKTFAADLFMALDAEQGLGWSSSLWWGEDTRRLEMFNDATVTTGGFWFNFQGDHLEPSIRIGVDSDTMFQFQTDAGQHIYNGLYLRIYDATDADYGQFSHDGTDFNAAFTNTTDWNVTGLTNFSVAGNVTATTIGGILEANLLDKEAVEAITGDWTFSGTTVVPVATVTAHEAAIDHDALTNYVAAEHIDWSVTGLEDVHVDRISAAAVTQHQAALAITESQITDLDHYTDTDANLAIDTRVTKAFVDALNVDADTLDGIDSLGFALAAHTHTEAEITDLDHYTDADVTALVTKAFIDALNVDADTLDGVDSTGFALASHAHALGDLSDVGTATPTARHAILGDGDSFESRAIVEADISDLGAYLTEVTDDDVNSEAATDGHVLTADGAGGAVWEAPPGAGASLPGDPNVDAILFWDDSDGAAEWTTSLPDSFIAVTGVTQHQASLTITESQISDLDHYTNTDANAAIDARVTKAFIDALNVDADTLDGNDSAAFSLAGHDHDADYAALVHNHDDRYYTETEIDAFAWLDQTEADALYAALGHSHTVDGLSDAVITTPADNEVLAFNTATSQWINQTAAEAGLATASHTHTESEITDLDHYTDTDANAAIDARVTKAFVDALNVDADTLDGIDSTGFSLSGHSHALGALSDVGTATPTLRHALMGDGDSWESRALVEADISDLDHYTDTDANAAIDARVTKAFVDALNVDADTIDGLNSTAFSLTSHSHTLDGLSDVVITTVADNEVLAFNNATSQWINQTAAEAGLSVVGHTHTESEITDLDHYTDTDANLAIDARVTKAFVDALNIDADTLDGVNGASFATLASSTEVFTGRRGFSGVLNAANGGAINVTGDSPTIIWSEDDGGVDEKNWGWQVASEMFRIIVASDAAPGTTVTTPLVLTRGTGTGEIASISLAAASILANGSEIVTIADDAASLTSGAATDGHVLTADGAGGAAWEAQTGGSGLGTYSPSDTDITGLVPGTASGTLIESPINAHIVLGIRENDLNDSVSIISGGGDYSGDNLYDLLIAQFKSNEINLNTPVRLPTGGDLSLTSTTHPFQLGPTSGVNISMDTNEIMCRNNGAAETLNLNTEGGTVFMGGDLIVTGTTTFNGNVDIAADHINGWTMDINEIYADAGGFNDPSYTFVGDEDTGMYRDTTNRLGFTAGGTKTLLIGPDTIGFFGTLPVSRPHFSIGSDDIVDLAAALNSLGLITTGP